MVSKDIELKIRATNNASKALGEIEQSLADLKKQQMDTASSTGAVDQNLTKLAASFTKLEAELKDLDELASLSSDLDKVAIALAKTARAADAGDSNFADLKREVESAAIAIRKLQKELGSVTKGVATQNAKVVEARKEFSALERNVNKQARSYTNLSEKSRQAGTANRELTKEVKTQAEALKRATSQRDRAATTLAKEVSNLDNLKRSRASLTAELRKSNAEQSRNSLSLDKATASTENQRNRLASLNAEYGKLNGRATQLRSSLGLVEGSQLEIANAAKRASTEVSNLTKILKDQSSVRLPSARRVAATAQARPSVGTQDLATLNLQLAEAQNTAKRIQNEVSAIDNPPKKLTAELLKSQKVAAELRKQIQQAVGGQASGLAATARAQVETTKALGVALAQARQEATKLGAALAIDVAPTSDLINQFAGARERVRALKDEYFKLAASQNQIRTTLGQTVQVLRNITTQTQASATSIKNFRQTLSEVGGAAAVFRGVLQQIAPSLRAVSQAATGAGAALLGVTTNSATAAAALRALRGQVIGVTASYIGFFAAFNQINGVITSLRTLEAAQSRLNVVFDGDLGSSGRELAFLRSEASRLGLEFGVLTGEYTKLAVAAKVSNIENAVTRDLFISVAEAGRVNKLSQEQLERVFLALTQTISKGKFQAEEVTQQFGESLPGAINILARAVSKVRGELVTVPEIFKEMEKGSLLASEAILQAFGQEIRKEFSGQLPEALNTTTTQLDALANTVTQARLAVGGGEFSDTLRDSLALLNKELSSPAAQTFFIQLGEALAGAVKLLVLFGQNLDLVGSAIATFIAYKVLGTMAGWSSGILLVRLSIQALNVAAVTSSKAIAALLLSFNVASIGTFLKSLLTMRISLGAVKAGFVAAGAATLAFGNSLVVARSKGGAIFLLLEALIKVALALGIALGGGALLDYATSIDGAAEATQRYEGEVQSALQAIKASDGNVEALQERLSELSETEVSADISTFAQGIADAKEKISLLVSETEGLSDVSQLVLKDLATLYENGAITATQYAQAVTKLATADPKLDKVAADLRDNIRESEALESKIDNLESILKIMGGTAKEAAQGIRELNNKMSTSSSAAAGATVDLGAYASAVENLVKRTKKGRQELERLQINEEFQAGVQALTPVIGPIGEEQSKQLDELRKVRDQANKEFEESINPTPRAARAGRTASAPRESEAEKQAKKQLAFDMKLKENSEDRIFKTQQAGIEDEKIRTVAEAKQRAITDAQRDGLQISQQQIALIEREVGLLFDAENKRKGFEDSEEALNVILEGRKLILEKIELLRNNGDNSSMEQADQLTQQLKGVEDQAVSAAEKARVFALALGDANAVANLDNIILGLRNVEEAAAITAVQVNQALGQGGAQAIDNFAQAVVGGVGVFQALGDAARQFFSDFLRQIAQAIAQQAILNALGATPQGGGGGGGVIAGLIGGLFHSGGVVGDGAPASRAVALNTFNNAKRYHAGGLAGLKPDEVPAILQKNEEVLTRTDPRHRNNGGMTQAAPANIRVINTINPGEFVSQGFNTVQGEQAVLNFMRANRSKIKGIIG